MYQPLWAMDVDSDESVKSAVADVLAQAGHVDVLVNNAGMAQLGVDVRPHLTASATTA